MNRALGLVSIVILSVGLALPVTYAEEGPNAQCHVREKGKDKEKKSGPCTMTEEAGNIWILLKNGESITLKPGKKKEHFRDQRDKVAKRSYEAGVAVYKWEKKTIKVNPDAS